MSDQCDRRSFVKIAAAAGMAWSAAPELSAGEAAEAKVQPTERVRLGLVGVGNRGTALLGILLGLEGVEVKAICDLIPERVAKAQDAVTAASARPKEGKVHTANSYPTHPIGPVAQWMDINRGSRFDYLVSMSADGTEGNRHADINTSLIRTARGQTITLYFDTKLPRPYDLIYRVQGTRGICMASWDKIYVEGRSPQADTWEPMEAYYKQFEHPLWKALGQQALKRGGHGGGDWMEMHRLIQALRTGTAPDMDVYDAATWNCITELSEKSVATKSSPMDFPDFTRGRWKTAAPIGIIGA